MANIILWEEIKIPNGKTSGSIKTTCPHCSHTRKKKSDPCLSVDLDKGVAKCWNCDNTSSKKESIYTLPDQSWRNYTELSDNMVKWFKEERGLSQKTLIDCKITEEKYYQPSLKKNVNNIVFNYFYGDVVVNKKYRSANKKFTQCKNAKKIFYGINDVSGHDHCYIVEGEMDKLAFWEMGIENCISVPNGAKDLNDIFDTCKKDLEGIEKFYIAVDNDEPGKELEDNLVRRLGAWRCEKINFNHKDANDQIIKDRINFKKCVDNPTKYPISGTFSALDLKDDILDYYRKGAEQTYKPSGEEWNEFNEIFSILPGQLTTVTGIPSHGKALDVNTPIPTPNGFVNLIDLKVGDEVFDENGDICKIRWKSEVFKNRPTYEITFSDNSKLIADENHEWLTDTWKSRRSSANAKRNGRDNDRDLKPRGTDQSDKRTYASIKTTKEIAETVKYNGKNNHSINNCKPISCDYTDLLIDPYVLGCWLGDGTSADGGFTTEDEEIVENIKNRFWTVTKRKNKYGYGIIGLKSVLRKEDLLNNKHIPNKYLFSDELQRWELLRGLMDTDGHASKVEPRMEYCGTNKRLVEDVYSLVCSLGIKATFVEGDAKLNGRVVGKKYRVFFTAKKHARYFNLDRKQDVINHHFQMGRKTRGSEIRYIKEVKLLEDGHGIETQCIEVTSHSHLFLAGRNFIPTHNSNWLEWYVISLLNTYDFMKVSFFSPEHLPMSSHQAVLAEKFVGKSFEMGHPNRMTVDEIEEYINWSKDRIVLTTPDEDESANWDWIFKKFKEQIFNYGTNIFVIDAFNKVRRNSPDSLGEISDILGRLTAFAQAHRVHIFLVAHPTKMKKNEDGTYEMPSLYDVKGSGDFRDQTHNGIAVYRHFQEDGSGHTEIKNLKAKFKHQGSGNIGKSVNMMYDTDNGRYYKFGGKKNRKMLIEAPDREPELNLTETEQITEQEYYSAGSMSRHRPEIDESFYNEETPF